MIEPSFDDDDRELCIDGACVGLVGPDGRCKVCGLAAREGTPYREAPATPPDELVPGADVELVSAPTAPTAPTGDDWEDRRLCADGACIGVLGADGRCTTCGRAG